MNYQNSHNLEVENLKKYEEALKDFGEGEILGYFKNNLDQYVVAIFLHDVIYLLGDPYQTIMFAPKLLLSKVGDKGLKIEDILVKNNNIGNGSILMKALFKYAEKHHYTSIEGYLSNLDLDHQSRLHHYYKKFGFDIKPHSIYKEL